MGISDQQAVKAEMDKAKRKLGVQLGAVVAALTRLAMFDMLPALAALDKADRLWLYDYIVRMKDGIGAQSYARLCFAQKVVEDAEIAWFDIPEEQVNDGRVYLKCTRLYDKDVQEEIDIALREAAAAIANNKFAITRPGTTEASCCSLYEIAWSGILVVKRNDRGSRISSLCAAAHYMLARYQVCCANAAQWQMDGIIDSYDVKKMGAIALGNKDLTWMSIKPGNLPYPPDFAIRRWAYKGSEDGAADRRRCNSDAWSPVIPHIAGGVQ